MRPEKIIGFYRTRFQIEFGIRDAKQFTGLQSQQTRDRERLDFAFNLSFTALNVCKEVIRKDYPDLSVAQFKRLMFESYLASTIISTCGKSPHLKINSENKSSVGSVSGLAKTEQPQILPNHC